MSKQTKIDIKGSIGELRQEMRLYKLDREKYKVINNIIISYKDKTSQIDDLVILVYGIFVIENKNFSGNIYVSEKDRNWIQIMGKSKNSFNNPVLQNKGYIKALEEIFGKANIESDDIRVINERDLYSTITSYEEVRGYWYELLDAMRGVTQDNAKNVKKFREIIEESSRICLVCKG